MQINGAGILWLFSKVEIIGNETNDNLKIENRGKKNKNNPMRKGAREVFS